MIFSDLGCAKPYLFSREARRRAATTVSHSALEDKTSYSDTFFVPKIARWNDEYTEDGKVIPALKDEKDNVGQRLTQAIYAIEDDNNEYLEGVLKGSINFNRTQGKTTIPNQHWVE